MKSILFLSTSFQMVLNQPMKKQYTPFKLGKHLSLLMSLLGFHSVFKYNTKSLSISHLRAWKPPYSKKIFQIQLWLQWLSSIQRTFRSMSQTWEWHDGDIVDPYRPRSAWKNCVRPSHLPIICYHLMDHECEGRVTWSKKLAGCSHGCNIWRFLQWWNMAHMVWPLHTSHQAKPIYPFTVNK